MKPCKNTIFRFFLSFLNLAVDLRKGALSLSLSPQIKTLLEVLSSIFRDGPLYYSLKIRNFLVVSFSMNSTRSLMAKVLIHAAFDNKSRVCGAHGKNRAILTYVHKAEMAGLGDGPPRFFPIFTVRAVKNGPNLLMKRARGL